MDHTGLALHRPDQRLALAGKTFLRLRRRACSFASWYRLSKRL